VRGPLAEGSDVPVEAVDDRLNGMPCQLTGVVFGLMVTVVWVSAAPRWSAMISWAMPVVPSVRV
jgi:hypothetical protein